jgi:hypothetical protein
MSARIVVAEAFSRYPAGRFQGDGPFSGERFRDELLVPALRRGGMVEVVLDGTLGYGSSFLEEAFGGLMRESNFVLKDLETRLRVVSLSDPTLGNEAWQYIRDAAARRR